MKRLFHLMAVLAAISASQAEMRMWTNTSGQIVEAEMTGVNATTRAVQVRLKDGKIAQLPIENLSPPDKEYAKQQWEQIRAAAPSASATPSAADLAKFPARYASRFSVDTRRQKVLESGVQEDVEPVIIRSLDKFKADQNADGSWGRANKAAMTGFALQCFLGHGESADSSAYGDTVIKAIAYLIQTGKNNPHGLLSEKWQGSTGGGGTYEHAIATDAIGQAYILARLGAKSLPGMRECFEKAITLIIEQQSDRGSWGYGGKDIIYNKSANDLSVANWHFLALQAAKDSTLAFPGLDAAISRAASYIKDMQTRDGGYGGSDRDRHYNQWSLSGGGGAGLLLLDEDSGASAKKGIQFLSNYLTNEPPDWDKTCNLYSWHGYANFLCLSGGAEWQTFAKKIFPQIIAYNRYIQWRSQK